MRVVWLNGSFGAGKTTVAQLLVERLADAELYDPEPLGARLRLMRPRWWRAADFQDIPAWRARTVDAIRARPGTVVVPMTVHDPTIFDETVGALRRLGIAVHHFTLVAPVELLASRIASRPGDRSWELARVDRCVTALAGPAFAVHVDASGPAEGVAAAILDRLA